MSVVGELALWTALFLAAWGCALSLVGARLRRADLVESGARGVLAGAGLTALAAVALWTAFFRHDFTLSYVAEHSTLNTPPRYLVAAFWAGTPGVALWWSLALAIGSAVEVATRRRRGDPTAPVVTASLAALLFASQAAVCFAWNPFDRAEWVPGDGRGLSPAYMSGWAISHFATLYPAYAAATLAIVAATAEAGRARQHGWSPSLRGWMLITWCLLTLGIACGMRWSYTEPSLGAGWSWNAASWTRAALWLVVTGLVRSLLVRRSSFEQGATTRRAPAMYGVYLGAAVLLVGLAAQAYWRDEVVRLRPGQTARLRDPYRASWRLVSQGASREERVDYLATGVAVEAWRGARRWGIISAERRQYLDSGQQSVSEPAMEPGIRSSPTLDLYLLLTEMRGELAVLRVGFRPLVSLVWLGWALVVVSVFAVVLQLSGAERATTRAPEHARA